MLRRPSKLWIDVRRTIHRHPFILLFYDMLSSAKQYVKGYTRSRMGFKVLDMQRTGVFLFSANCALEGGDFNHRGFLCRGVICG